MKAALDPREQRAVEAALDAIYRHPRLAPWPTLRELVGRYGAIASEVFVCPSWQEGLCDAHSAAFADIVRPVLHWPVWCSWFRVTRRRARDNLWRPGLPLGPVCYQGRRNTSIHCVACVKLPSEAKLLIDWTPRQYDTRLPVPLILPWPRGLPVATWDDAACQS